MINKHHFLRSILTLCFVVKDYQISNMQIFYSLPNTKIGRFSRVSSSRNFFEILELKFTFVNEHFNISKVTKKLILVKNAKNSL